MLAAHPAVSQDQLAPDFRTRTYSPPVHIPPRIPLLDPGLPETLNGRFNSTQHIRSDQMSAGHRTNISDLNDQNASFPATPTDARWNGQSTNVSQSRPRRRAGLQDKISRLISGNKRRQTDYREPADLNNGERAVGPTMPLSTTSENRSYNPINRFAPRTMQPDRIQQTPSYSANRPIRPVSVRTADYPQESLIQAQASRSDKIPAQSTDFAEPARNFRRTSMQQMDAASPDVGERISGFVEQTGGPELRSAQSGSGFNTRANARKKRKPELRSPERKDEPAKPVSVLRKREDEVLLAPDDMYEDSVELSDPDSFDSDSLAEEEEFYESSSENVLRNRKTRWNRNSIQDETTEDEEFLLESPFNDDESDGENQNPLEKSCEYFRRQLLNQPITEIALDMSPPGKQELFGENQFRVWRDADGNQLTQGTISDLRRGYVVVDTGNGEVRLPYARLSDADWAAISEYWYLPTECGLGGAEYRGRCWIPQTATWHASALCHKPLYFENVQLERYGHTHGPFLQPVVSTGHFFVRLFFLPYNSAIHPPNECQYALGFYRPGNCAPWLRDPVPISLKGAVSAGLFYTAIGTITR